MKKKNGSKPECKYFQNVSYYLHRHMINSLPYAKLDKCVV